MNNYGIDLWGDDNFIIENGKLKLNYGSKPFLIDIVNDLRDNNGLSGPLLLRFPHITQKQISLLYTSFNNSIKEYKYNGEFKAVFPLKVNQLPNHILPMLEYSKKLNYGLEAGSKPELLLAIALNNNNSPITINGFKDKDMITIAFIAYSQGQDINIIIEGLNELEIILDVYKELNLDIPNIGLRLKLHSSGDGTWAKSGGINSKFGLSSIEILEAVDILKDVKKLDKLTMIHFHIGSDMTTITPLKKALRESGHIYVELRKLGVSNLCSIDIGGGLGLEYSQFERNKQYSLKEFTSDVIFTIKDIANKNSIEEPDIFIESGRFISAPSSVLIVPTLELYSSEYNIQNLRLKKTNPPIIEELNSLYNDIEKINSKEYLHDSLEHLESILTLFDLGYVDLVDRSNAEVLTHLIIKKAISLEVKENDKELRNLESKIQEKYLLNFSIFQSLPDLWGIGQEFPILPITNLDKKANRSATIWDITCDSDGEIPFNSSKPLYLHDIDLSKENYFIGFFLVGAYQDILGMKHNLFSSPSQVNIKFKNNKIDINKVIKSQSINDISEDLGYNKNDIKNRLSNRIKDKELRKLLNNYLEDNSYLKSILLTKSY
ncbi:MAG: biosynthetic arginine decarboxylase [Campylobacterota bacterium]|nr:biosynthetic arginine decarboxylase [Campylobacterota bacterium]